MLGTPAVTGETGTVAGAGLGGRRARVALVALALARTTVLSERLADMIWADDRPATWPVALRGVVRGLRSALAEIGGGEQGVIVPEPRGSLFHAFMCSRIRLRRSAAGLSRNPTVSFTPAAPQYEVVITAMRCGGWFIGLIRVAVRAASTSMLLGNLFSRQQIKLFFFMGIQVLLQSGPCRP